MNKKIVTLGVLTTVAIVVSYVERLIPLQAFVHIPGIKLGIANCVLLFILSRYNFKSAFLVLISKNIITSLLFSGITSLMYSFAGGVLSVFGMYLLLKSKKYFSNIGVSIFGSALFNVGQIVLASLILGSGYIYLYLPILLLCSIVTGFVTGVVTNILLKHIKN